MKRRDVLRSAIGAAGLFALPRVLLAHGVQEPSNLDTALRAERWIRRSRIETEHGIRWPADPTKPAATTDLYNGFPGVVLFLLELFHTTGDRRYLDEAMRGAS